MKYFRLPVFFLLSDVVEKVNVEEVQETIEELDEEILREMMEEEDRESILPWKKHGEKYSRKEGRNGKRS